MAIYTTAQYKVRPEGVEKVQRAIEEFVPWVKANEPGTRMYPAWQQEDDPTRFVHFFIFDHKAAHEAHSKSEAVKRFEAAYAPELDGGGVIFTDYMLIASNQDAERGPVWRKDMADIEHSIEIAAKPETVYALVATAKGFGEWWATDITEHDGVVELGFYNRSTVYRLRPVTERPPAEAEWVCETGGEWKDTHILFRLSDTKSGSLLRFTHAGWASVSQYFVSCNTTWGELMFRIKAAGEGKSRGPLFLAAEMA